MTMIETPVRKSLIHGFKAAGQLNVPPEVAEAQVASALRLGYPQVWRQREHGERVVLVGSGPSLADTEDELIQLVHEGAVLVTVNGGYHWCRERRLLPRAQIVLDARASTARFLTPHVPRCKYYLASQCHADAWAAVADYEDVAIYHATGDNDAPIERLLDAHYGADHWQTVVGAGTVATRAIGVLRTLGFLRFDLFGIDCCWLHGQHHAIDQPENAHEKMYRLAIRPGDGREAREFLCAPWHVAQLDDFLTLLMHPVGWQFKLHAHGAGLLAYAIETLGTATFDSTEVVAEQGVI